MDFAVLHIRRVAPVVILISTGMATPHEVLGTTHRLASIVDSGMSQADDLHTDRTFDLASSGFGLHDEITQNQGQSRTKAGSLTEEVVIGGRSRSQEATTNLWVNLAGDGNWTETNTSGWSESASQSVEDYPLMINQSPTDKKGWAPVNALATP